MSRIKYEPEFPFVKLFFNKYLNAIFGYILNFERNKFQDI